MMSQPEIRESLLMFAQTLDPILQKVVVKIIFCMMDTKELKYVAFYVTHPSSSLPVYLGGLALSNMFFYALASA